MMKRTLIIAEAGVNHNGDFKLAKKLIDTAADSGADYVKFQTFKADKLVSQSAKKADYQIKNLEDQDISQYSMLKNLEMPEEWHYKLKDYCSTKGIAFLSTGFDEYSIDFLDRLGVPFFKIPSGEITNKPYLEHIARKQKPVILSTGMATLEEVKQALWVLTHSGLVREQITILHCNTEYPTPMEDVNLFAMKAIQLELGVGIGYSDHTAGIEIPIAAVALGAQVIEKHFTLDKNLPGPDHKASLEPYELQSMVRAIRNVEMALSGSGLKVLSPSEARNVAIARKSIHLLHSRNTGDTIREHDVIMLRPGDGISPMQMDEVIGKRLRLSLAAYTKLAWEHLL